MSRLRAFFQRIWLCITDPSSYRALQGKTFGQGLKYLYGLLVLLSVLFALRGAYLMFSSMSAVRTILAEAQAELPGLYPEELVITIKDGTVSTNVEEPYTIDVPQRWKEKLKGKDGKEFDRHLVTIDTSASAEDFPAYNSLLLVAGQSLIFPDKNGAYKIQPISDVEDFTLDHAKYASFVNMVLPFTKYLLPLLTVLIVVLIILSPFLLAASRLFGLLLYLLLTVLLLWIFSKFRRFPFTYGDIYRLSLFGLTVPLLYGLLELLLSFHVPWAYTLLFLVWTGVVLVRLAPFAAASIQVKSHSTAKRKAGNAKLERDAP